MAPYSILRGILTLFPYLDLQKIVLNRIFFNSSTLNLSICSLIIQVNQRLAGSIELYIESVFHASLSSRSWVC